MKAPGRRLRGWLLRLVLNRAVAAMAGLALLGPALWMMAGDYAWETPATDGIGLIVGATGAALVAAAIGGRRPDWVDPDDPR